MDAMQCRVQVANLGPTDGAEHLAGDGLTGATAGSGVNSVRSIFTSAGALTASLTLLPDTSMIVTRMSAPIRIDSFFFLLSTSISKSF
jgi:hypothetical protein